jgi:Flp pilus assembly protein TadD
LRALGSNSKAADVLSDAVAAHENDPKLLAAYAKALTAAGRSKEALPVFAKAEKLRPRDWTLLSAEGIALDQLGRHTQARARYGWALQLSPNNPDIMVNMALSDTLSGNLGAAERILRKAANQPGAGAKVRQNLALVLGLRGQFSEANRLARADLTPAAADHNVAMMRQMFEQPALWAEAAKQHPMAKVATQNIAAPGARAVPSSRANTVSEELPGNPPADPMVPPPSAQSMADTTPPTRHAVTALRGSGSGITAAILARPNKRAAVKQAAVNKRPALTQVASASLDNGVDDRFFPFPW